MRRLSTAILAIGIALVFVIYMVTYTVSYNQTAIITTFGKATPAEPALRDEGKDTGSVMQEPGLKFKWPWPIQRVQTYPTQLQVLRDTPEQLALKDNNTLIINLNLTWRIKDPLAFSISLGTLDQAQDMLLAQMRNLRSEISTNYAFDDLVNEDPTKVQLRQMEQNITQKLTEQLAKITPSYGIEVASVTVGQMLYAESTAASVNQKMKTTQDGKAEYIRRQGSAQAEAIIAEANSISDQLNNFARTVASKIEIIGIEEANAYYKRYAEAGSDQDLAIFLRQLEAIERILANRTTFLLDARTFTPLDVLIYGHGGPGNLSRLFNTPDGKADAATTLPTPVNPELQAQSLSRQIQALQVRIAELEQQLLELELPTPVQTISDRDVTEARP